MVEAEGGRPAVFRGDLDTLPEFIDELFRRPAWPERNPETTP
jgi:hypothetical protein